MRKDTRVGVAIGLVLFLVLIVYAIAVPKSTTKKTVTLDKKGKTAQPVEGLSTNATPPLKAETPANTGSATGEQPAGAGAGTAMTTVVAKDPASDGASNTNWAALLSAQDKMDSAGLRTRTPDMAQPDGASPRTGGSHGAGEVTGKTGTARTEASNGTHRVAENETFASIARSVYGDVKYANLIAKANPSIDPRRLRAGMTIRLPEKSAISTDSATLAAGTVKANGTGKAVNKSDKEYTVQSNDSLYRISMKLFGRGDKADAIYELNKQVIGSDPAKLKVGMVLKVPQASTPVTTASAAH